MSIRRKTSEDVGGLKSIELWLLGWSSVAVLVVGLVVFWIGNASLISSHSDALFHFDYRDEMAKSGSNFGVLHRDFRSGLGIWSEGTVRISDFPHVVANYLTGYTAEWIYVGLWIPVLFISAFALARSFGYSFAAAQWTGVISLFALIFPSPFLWSRISIQGLHFVQFGVGGLLLASLLRTNTKAATDARISTSRNHRLQPWLQPVVLLAWVASLFGLYAIVLLEAVVLWFFGYLVACRVTAKRPKLRPWILVIALLSLLSARVAQWLAPSMSLGRKDYIQLDLPNSFSFPILQFTNMSFLGRYGNTFAVTAILVLSCVGICLSWYRRNYFYSSFALAVSVGYALFALLHQAIGLLFGIEMGPRPFYLEGVGWIPVVVPGIGGLIAELVRFVGQRMMELRLLSAKVTQRVSLIGPVLMVGLWGLIWIADNRELQSEPSQYPVVPGHVTQGVLAKLADPSTFRGRVMILENPDYEISPFILSGETFNLWQELIAARIPTLQTYSHVISDRLAESLHTWFVDERDYSRTQLTFNHLNIKVAQLLGIRYVLVQCDSNYQLGLSLSEKVDDLCVYELEATNLGDFSPTKVIPETSGAETITSMASASFDPRHEVFIDRQVGNLVEASSVAFRANSGSVTIDVETSGRSLVVLPLEYSSCMKVSSQVGEVEVLRVNHLLTGILVTESGQYSVEVKKNLFGTSSCF